jgi:hypothetical protein
MPFALCSPIHPVAPSFIPSIPNPKLNSPPFSVLFGGFFAMAEIYGQPDVKMEAEEDEGPLP